MTVSAAKPEEKRLGWFVPTAVDQAESCVKPAAEGRNLARMPNPQHSETERLVVHQFEFALSPSVLLDYASR